MSFLSIPTSAALSPSQLLHSTHPTAIRTLQRLSRPSLLTLALDWLSDQNQENELTTPYLTTSESEGDEQDLYPPAHSLEELREIYAELQARKGSKRDVLDRILEGDWRDGVSLYQLAMADMQYLYDHPTSQKWSALKLVRLEPGIQHDKKATTSIPRFHPPTFLRNLQKEVLPDIKAHYNLDRYEKLGLMILRVFIVDSPYNTGLALPATEKYSAAFDSSRTFYVAFPDASPYIYVSLTTTISTTPGSSISDNKSLRKLVLDGIPKAFSRPRDRYSLESTGLSARNLEALVEKRGSGRTNAAGGGWGVYTEENKKDTPLNVHLPTPESLVEDGADKTEAEKVTSMKRRSVDDEQVVKRRKLVAKGRFGNSAKHDDGKGVERLEVMIKDPFPSTTSEPFDEPELDVSPENTDAERGKKRKGRRSTLDLEINKQGEEDEVEAEGWRPNIRAVFQGKHVFAGVRNLIEEGVIDGEKMPGWMTGEEGVSVGLVQNGRIKGNKGSGM
jgi:central kinetochore subunit Mis15/CHL4